MNTKILNFAPRNDGAGIDVTLYGVIGDDWFGPPIEAEIAAQLGAAPDAHATVHINSEGGDMFAGIAIRNMFAAHRGGVTCIVEGLAASAASIIAMAGKTVMGKGSMLMIHNPWAIVAGGAEDLRATADMLDKAQASLISIYQEKTGKSTDELKALLDAETWFTADEALAAGFANEVSSEKQMEVSALADAVVLNSVSFPRAKVPAQILAMAKAPAPETCSQCGKAKVNGLCPDNAWPHVADARSLTRSLLADKAPGLLAELLDEGKVAERARLKEIDDLNLPAALSALVIAAKYGDAPTDAATLSLAAWKAASQSRVDLLAARRDESAAAASINPPVPDAHRQVAEEAAAAKQIAEYANARRGGTQ